MREWGKHDMRQREFWAILAFLAIFLSPLFIFATSIGFSRFAYHERAKLPRGQHWRTCKRWCHGLTLHNNNYCLHCDPRFKYQPRDPKETVSYDAYYGTEDYLETRNLLDSLKEDLKKHETPITGIPANVVIYWLHVW